MTAATLHAQQERIAKILGVDAEEVHGLDDVSAEDLRTLHTQISERLGADKRRRFARIAGLSRTLPAPIAGKLAEKFLPPKLGAQAAELLDPAQARDLVGSVSIGYLADLAINLHPMRSQEVVRAIPASRVGEVARELFGRHEYTAMAEFVGSVELDALYAALTVASPHDLLAVAPLLTWNDNLDVVVAGLPEDQIQQIITELNPTELADLALALDPARFGPVVAALPVDTVADIARELFARSEHAAMARFAQIVTDEMLSATLAVASCRDLLIVTPLLDWNARLDRAFENMPGRRFDAVIVEIAAHEMWTEGGYLIDQLSEGGRSRVLTSLTNAPEATYSALKVAARQGRLGTGPSDLVNTAGKQRP